MVFGLTVVSLVVVGLVLGVIRLAASRDRSRHLWGGLALAAAGGAFFGAWRWMVSGVDALDPGAGTLLAAFAVLIGPVVAALLVLLGLARLPAGPPRVRAPIAARMSAGSRTGQIVRLQVQGEALRIVTAVGERRLARVDLARIEADGEVLRLKLRGGDELRFHVTEHADPHRRRRLCEALAGALGAPVAGVTVRQG